MRPWSHRKLKGLPPSGAWWNWYAPKGQLLVSGCILSYEAWVASKGQRFLVAMDFPELSRRWVERHTGKPPIQVTVTYAPEDDPTAVERLAGLLAKMLDKDP